MPNGKCNLLKCDDKQTAMGMTTVLKSMGYAVTIEHDGKKVLTRVVDRTENTCRNSVRDHRRSTSSTRLRHSFVTG